MSSAVQWDIFDVDDVARVPEHERERESLYINGLDR
jgi:hypothetical protein